jgi:hypothetical protein
VISDILCSISDQRKYLLVLPKQLKVHNSQKNKYVKQNKFPYKKEQWIFFISIKHLSFNCKSTSTDHIVLCIKAPFHGDPFGTCSS